MTNPTLAEMDPEAERIVVSIAMDDAGLAHDAERRFRALLSEVETLRAQLNTPEIHDFTSGVILEAQHQRARWGSEHDSGKDPQVWFWLLGYLGGQALKAALTGDHDKALHHCISSAAVLANWHAALM